MCTRRKTGASSSSSAIANAHTHTFNELILYVNDINTSGFCKELGCSCSLCFFFLSFSCTFVVVFLVFFSLFVSSHLCLFFACLFFLHYIHFKSSVDDITFLFLPSPSFTRKELLLIYFFCCYY